MINKLFKISRDLLSGHNTAISVFKKYLFGIIVSAYVLSVIGVPVYLHYCGGELEKVNYVVKSNSCCDGEDDDSAPATNDCCKDENIFIKNSTDFTLKQFNNYDLVKTFCNLFYIQLPFSDLPVQSIATSNTMPAEPAPPRLQNSNIISTSVLRI